MNKHLFIITDTGADLPKEFKNVIRVPLHYSFGEITYKDGDITKDEFDRLSNISWPITSGPSAGEYADAYQNAYELGAEFILCLPISEKLSGSYNSAILGLKEIKHKNIMSAVVDTRSLTLGIGFLVEMLMDMAKNPSTTFGELVEAASTFHDHERIYVVLDTLDNVVKGGRVKPLMAKLSSILNLKHILTIDTNGDLEAFAKVRTYQKALNYIFDKVMNTTHLKRIGLMYSDNKEIAKSFADRLWVGLNDKGVKINASDIPIVKVCEPIYVHAGSNAFGVCIIN